VTPTSSPVTASVKIFHMFFENSKDFIHCEDDKACLKEMVGKTSDSAAQRTAGLKLRNSNPLQLECLENQAIADVEVAAKCSAWKACLSLERAMHILDYLRAITSSLSDSTAAEVATTATTLLQAKAKQKATSNEKTAPTPLYITGVMGANSCVEGKSKIASASSCSAAAAQLGYTDQGSEDEAEYPSGCYTHPLTSGATGVYFNTASPGTGHSQATPLCDGTATATATSDPPTTAPPTATSTCPYEDDGVCDVPEYCAAGTDLADCALPTLSPTHMPNGVDRDDGALEVHFTKGSDVLNATATIISNCTSGKLTLSLGTSFIENGDLLFFWDGQQIMKAEGRPDSIGAGMHHHGQSSCIGTSQESGCLKQNSFLNMNDPNKVTLYGSGGSWYEFWDARVKLSGRYDFNFGGEVVGTHTLQIVFRPVYPATEAPTVAGTCAKARASGQPACFDDTYPCETCCSTGSNGAGTGCFTGGSSITAESCCQSPASHLLQLKTKQASATAIKTKLSAANKAGQLLAQRHTAMDTPQCLNPSLSDAESWECSCHDQMIQECGGTDPAFLGKGSLAQCYKFLLCTHDRVCSSWKTDRCPASWTTAAETTADDLLSLLTVEGRQKAAVGWDCG